MKTKVKDTLGSLLSLNSIEQTVADMAENKSPSTARYFTFDKNGTVGRHEKYTSVCFNGISNTCENKAGLGIFYQGYGGFEQGDRWRPATEADLYTNQAMPFVQIDGGQYGKESLEWLKFLLDPEGPFKSLLPVMLETDPEKVQSARCFVFPDTSLIPARLAWCFAIASRIGFANARVLWRYIHMLDKGVDRRTAFLIAGGFEHQVKNGEITGKIIKSYTIGCLGVDVTAYAGRVLSSTPIVDAPGATRNGTYGSSAVFLSGKMDLKNLIFDNWEQVIDYVQRRGREQSAEMKAAA